MYGPNLFRADETKVERIYKPPRKYATAPGCCRLTQSVQRAASAPLLDPLLTSTVHTRRLRISLMDWGDTVEAAKACRSDFEYLPMPFEKEELLSWIRQAAISNKVESLSSTND